MIDLKKIAATYYNEHKDLPPEVLLSASNSETKFKEIYEGRFILELLQNSRDAIIQRRDGVLGKVSIFLKDGALWVANNGIEFDENAVRGIVYIGRSTKSDKTLIGHKGIGFKSILEVSETVEIITNSGTLFFDKSVAKSKLNNHIEDVPLFFFPFYKDQTIASLGSDFLSYTTVFKFPLKQELCESDIEDKIEDFNADDVVFFGGISDLRLGKNKFAFSQNDNAMSVTKNNETSYFKKIDADFQLTNSDFNSLSKEEQKLFENDKRVELKFLVPMTKEGAVLHKEANNLYLFYKLEAKSGLSFLLHSFFIVNPDRKGLYGASKLNQIIFREVGCFVPEFLAKVQKCFGKNEALEVMAYKKRDNNGLENLYETLKKQLQELPLLYHEKSQEFLGRNEISIELQNESILFNREFIGDRPIINLSNSRVRDWLSATLGFKFVNNSLIRDECEKECLVQYNLGEENRIQFFQRFYTYVIKNRIDLKQRSILCTSNGLKAGSTKNVFYTSTNEKSTTAPLFADELSFLISGINLGTSFDVQEPHIGVMTYREATVIRRSLKAFEKNATNTEAKIAIIRFLKEQISFISQYEVFANANFQLPVIGEKKWAYPLYFPLYLQADANPWEMVDKNNWVDIDLLNSDNDLEGWTSFLRQVGVWRVPGLSISSNLEKEKLVIDWPKNYSNNFYSHLFSHWEEYGNRWEAFRKSSKSDESLFANSAIINVIKEKRFISIDAICYSSKEVAGLKESEFLKNEYKVLKKFLPIIESNQLWRDALTDLEIIPLSEMSIQQTVDILNRIKETYEGSMPEDSRAFRSFFNKVLSLVHDNLKMMDANNQQNFIRQLKESTFLAVSISEDTFIWEKGKNIIHNNDNSLFQSLSDRVKQSLPYRSMFTKRDKTEWGRFANKIGKPLKSILTIIPPETSEESYTIKEILCRSEYIFALLESELDRRLEQEEIVKISNYPISANQNLSYQIRIQDADMSVPQKIYTDWFIEDTIEKVAFIDKEKIADVNAIARLTGEVLAELIEDLSSGSIDWLILTVLKEKNDQGLSQIINLKNIDFERIQEIKSLIQENEEFPEEPFENTKRIQPNASVRETNFRTSKVVIEETEIDHSIDELRHLIDGAKTTFMDAEPTGGDNDQTSVKWATGNHKNRIPEKTRVAFGSKTKKTTGHLSEELVYNKLVSNDIDLLRRLGLEPDAFQVEWFNRDLTNEEIYKLDNSIGVGYDILLSPHNIAIEVKGSSSENQPFFVSSKEFIKMKELKNEYFLILVQNLYVDNGNFITVLKNPYEQWKNGKIILIEGKFKT